jgi:hypothetical protein
MNPSLIEWTKKSLRDGSTPIQIAAAIARGVAINKGLPRDSSEPELLSCGNLLAPSEIEYTPELVGAA